MSHIAAPGKIQALHASCTILAGKKKSDLCEDETNGRLGQDTTTAGLPGEEPLTNVPEPKQEWGRTWRSNEDWIGFTEQICE